MKVDHGLQIDDKLMAVQGFLHLLAHLAVFVVSPVQFFCKVGIILVLRILDRFLGKEGAVHDIHKAVRGTALIDHIDAERSGHGKGGRVFSQPLSDPVYSAEDILFRRIFK